MILEETLSFLATLTEKVVDTTEIFFDSPDYECTRWSI